MSAYTAALSAALKRTNLCRNQIAAEAGLARLSVERIFAGHVERPRKYTADAITRIMLKELNAEIRRKLDEVDDLRRVGKALKAAHISTYGRKEETQ